jgi:hypothetical protein
VVHSPAPHVQPPCHCQPHTHRLSTIKNADIIAVVQQGVIVEQGHHDELLRNPTGAGGMQGPAASSAPGALVSARRRIRYEQAWGVQPPMAHNFVTQSCHMRTSWTLFGQPCNGASTPPCPHSPVLAGAYTTLVKLQMQAHGDEDDSEAGADTDNEHMVEAESVPRSRRSLERWALASQ